MNSTGSLSPTHIYPVCKTVPDANLHVGPGQVAWCNIMTNPESEMQSAWQMPGGFPGQTPAMRQQQQLQQAAAIAAMRSGVAAGQAAGRFGMPSTSPTPGSPAIGGSMQPPRSPMGAHGQASSGPLATSRPGSGTFSVVGQAASPGLAPSRPGSGVFGGGVMQGRASGAASPAPGPVPGRGSPAPSLNQTVVPNNPQGPPRPLSPVSDAHQAPTVSRR
jgi:hypothetical protein